MQAVKAIQYLPHEKIDKTKWDECINNASNGLIYGYSWYLDAMAPGWDALVLDDYAVVMPLPWRKKYGIRYIFHPPLTAQLGVFGNALDASIVTQFLNAIPSHFQYVDLPLNYGNSFQIASFQLHERMNFVLNLQQDYEKTGKGYRENLKRNIKKWERYSGEIKNDIQITEAIKLVKEFASDLSENDLKNFEKVYQRAKFHAAKTYGVYNKQNELIASAVFLFSHNRAYYILVGNHPNGRTLGASHALIDAFIRDHSGQSLFLDFEGSDIQTLAFFYSSFGAKEEKYPTLKFNKLPWWVKWFKK